MHTKRFSGACAHAALAVAFVTAAWAAVTVPAAPPAFAGASSVSVAGETMSYVAAAGDINGLAVTVVSSKVRFTDSGPAVTITPGSGCVAVGANVVDCNPSGVAKLVVDLGDQDDSLTVDIPMITSIDGGDGNDSITGGPVRDVVEAGKGDDVVDGRSGADSLSGEEGGDTLIGGDDTDSLEGSFGNDTLDGGGGNADVLDGGPDDDTMTGGIGSGDTVTYDTRVNRVTVVIGTTGNGTGSENDSIGADVEKIIGGGGNDDLRGTGRGETFVGGAGDDKILGRGGPDTIGGEQGDDILVGEGDNDILTGGSGSDVLKGGVGDDSLDGGDGKDALLGAGGRDALDGGFGNDTLSGGGGPFDVAQYFRVDGVKVTIDGTANDGEPGIGEKDNVGKDIEILFSGNGNDVLVGSKDDESFNSGLGDDRIEGGGGSDSLSGSDGSDRLIGGDGNDSLLGGDGNDTLSGRGGDDSLDGGLGRDLIVGGRGEDLATYNRVAPVAVTLNDVADDGGEDEKDNVKPTVEDVSTGPGNDTLVGNRAANELSGGEGADILIGGDGPDGLNGGAGSDALVGGKGQDSLSGGGGRDRLNSRDGTLDQDYCGGAADTAIVDRKDRIAGDCEKIKR